MIWRFSDGTTVELGGNVEGPTLLAQRLREQLGRLEQVTIWPAPAPRVPFDKNDAALLDAFLQQQLDMWTRVRGLALTLKRPDDVPSLPAPPWAGQEFDPAVVY